MSDDPLSHPSLGLRDAATPELLALTGDCVRLFSLAQSADAVGKTDSLSEFRWRLRNGEGPMDKIGSAFSSLPVVEKAACLLELAVRSLDTFEAVTFDRNAPSDQIVDAYANARSAYFLASGYLQAIVHFRRQQSRKGAKGRRRLGDKTRERVRELAHQHRHQKRSREAAAVLIADDVGKSSSHVRKLLSELFPGDAWGMS